MLDLMFSFHPEWTTWYSGPCKPAVAICMHCITAVVPVAVGISRCVANCRLFSRWMYPLALVYMPFCAECIVCWWCL